MTVVFRSEDFRELIPKVSHGTANYNTIFLRSDKDIQSFTCIFQHQMVYHCIVINVDIPNVENILRLHLLRIHQKWFFSMLNVVSTREWDIKEAHVDMATTE